MTTRDVTETMTADPRTTVNDPAPSCSFSLEDRLRLVRLSTDAHRQAQAQRLAILGSLTHLAEVRRAQAKLRQAEDQEGQPGGARAVQVAQTQLERLLTRESPITAQCLEAAVAAIEGRPARMPASSATAPTDLGPAPAPPEAAEPPAATEEVQMPGAAPGDQRPEESPAPGRGKRSAATRRAARPQANGQSAKTVDTVPETSSPDSHSEG